jgi:hypothetical protein
VRIRNGPGCAWKMDPPLILGADLHALLEAVGLPDKFDDMGMVRESVEQGCRQPFISKYHRIPHNTKR